ncbi:MAG TPA: HAMP domain-containing histidine kinase, partial [bacterium]|nr:HAMP domain-containing histidine kinase [bacterium]
SFGVTVAACSLYAACVLTERAGIISSAGIYSNRNFREHIEFSTTVSVINIVSVFGILLVVWYLASHLSEMVREREYELISINNRLEKIQAERTGHMLRTTHELKAPFAAIHANSQLLLKGYCGKLPDNAYDVVLRISARCRRLTNEIQEMLQLTNLRSDTNESLQWRKLDLAGLLKWSIVQVSSVAEERTIEFETDIVPVSIYGIEDYLKMLFVNLLSNAVLYSHDSGRVRVKCYRADENEAEVIIEDEGIGIPGEKLPRIFDDYYRTDEALRHNKESSGLGLTIVKHVVQTQKINLKVESQPDSGTKFTLLFQSDRQKMNNTNIRGEVQYGIPAGC